MATKTRLNVNIDSELKAKAGELLNAMGLDYTTAVTVFLTKVVAERRIPFEVSVRKSMSVDEFLGSNWREGLDDIEDEWE